MVIITIIINTLLLLLLLLISRLCVHYLSYEQSLSSQKWWAAMKASLKCPDWGAQNCQGIRNIERKRSEIIGTKRYFYQGPLSWYLLNLRCNMSSLYIQWKKTANESWAVFVVDSTAEDIVLLQRNSDNNQWAELLIPISRGKYNSLCYWKESWGDGILFRVQREKYSDDIFTLFCWKKWTSNVTLGYEREIWRAKLSFWYQRKYLFVISKGRNGRHNVFVIFNEKLMRMLLLVVYRHWWSCWLSWRLFTKFILVCLISSIITSAFIKLEIMYEKI